MVIIQKMYKFSARYVQENIQFHELEPMYRQFHRILESFKITELKEDTIKEEDKDAPKPSKPQEKVQDQFAADEEAVEVKIHKAVWSQLCCDKAVSWF